MEIIKIRMRLALFVFLFVLRLGDLVSCEKRAIGSNDQRKAFKLQDRNECMEDSSAIYCLVDIDLKTRESLDPEAADKSMRSKKFFEEGVLHRGICVTRSCDLSEISLTTLQSEKKLLRQTLQACSSTELKKEGVFDGNVTWEVCESSSNIRYPTMARIYKGILFAIVLANIAGSIFTSQRDVEKAGSVGEYFKAFSIQRNWNSLSANNARDGVTWFEGIQGFRAMTMFVITILHFVGLLSITYIENTDLLDSTDIFKALFASSSILVQVFFCLDSFLMARPLIKTLDKQKGKFFATLFSHVIKRYLRLIPVLALTLGFSALMSRNLGPMTALFRIESDVCQEYWWTSLLFINNMFKEATPCMPHSWYLAAAFQLHCAGLLVVFLACYFPRLAKLILGLTLTGGIIVPGLITYVMGYPPIVTISQRNFHDNFMNDATFTHLYKTFEGNMGGFSIGIIAAFIQTWIEKNDIKISEKKWIPRFTRAIIPILLCIMAEGFMIVKGEENMNPIIAALHASLTKAIAAGITAFLIICIVNKCNLSIVNFFESEVFNIIGKLNYSTYLTHFIIYKEIQAYLTYPIKLGLFNVGILPLVSWALAYCVGSVVYILVELPFANLQKISSMKAERQKLNGKSAISEIGKKKEI